MRTTILIPLLLAASLCACADAREDLDERARALAERAAAERYTAAVTATQPLQTKWVETMRASLGRSSEPKVLAAALADSVLPALSDYRDALGKMPVQTDRLREIHAGMVMAHSDLMDSYTAFAADLSTENYEPRRERLGTSVQVFHAAQFTYRSSLIAYYEELGVTLLPIPPIRL